MPTSKTIYKILIFFWIIYASNAYSQSRKYQKEDLDNAYKEAAIIENKELSERIKKFPEKARIINREIAQAVRENNYIKAIQLTKKMDSIHPNNSDIQHFLAKMYVKIGEVNSAQMTFEKAIQLKSGNRWIYSNYATFLAEKGEMGKALEVLAETNKLFPDWSIAYNIIASIKIHQGKLDQAEKNYDLALKREPKSALIITNSGDLYYELGKKEKALERYQEALAIQPNFIRAYLGMAEVYHDKKEDEKMMKALDSCLTIQPQNIDALIFKRAYYVEKNKMIDACTINNSISAIDQSLKDLTLRCN